MYIFFPIGEYFKNVDTCIHQMQLQNWRNGLLWFQGNDERSSFVSTGRKRNAGKAARLTFSRRQGAKASNDKKLVWLLQSTNKVQLISMSQFLVWSATLDRLLEWVWRSRRRRRNILGGLNNCLFFDRIDSNFDGGSHSWPDLTFRSNFDILAIWTHF